MDMHDDLEWRMRRDTGEGEDRLGIELRRVEIELRKVIRFTLDVIREVAPARREVLFRMWEASANQRDMPDLREVVQALRAEK